MAKKLGSYFFQMLLGVDQLINALFGGMADETLSSRVYRAENKNKKYGKFFRPIIDGIFFWQDDHCFHSYISEVKRRHLPRELQEL